MTEDSWMVRHVGMQCRHGTRRHTDFRVCVKTILVHVLHRIFKSLRSILRDFKFEKSKHRIYASSILSFHTDW